jgi:hypothetical protein
MWRKIKFYVISATIITLAVTALYYRYAAQREGAIRRTVDAPAILQQVQQLSELVTVKYSIQKVVGLKEEKVPFGSESVLLMVQSVVLGGVNLASLQSNDVTVSDENRVTIRLPEPSVLHVFVNDKETKVWDRERTWWTPWVGYNSELEQKARLAALESMQAAALEMGILSNARQNAETTIRSVLGAAGVNSVKFETADGVH